MLQKALVYYRKSSQVLAAARTERALGAVLQTMARLAEAEPLLRNALSVFKAQAAEGVEVAVSYDCLASLQAPSCHSSCMRCLPTFARICCRGHRSSRQLPPTLWLRLHRGVRGVRVGRSQKASCTRRTSRCSLRSRSVTASSTRRRPCWAMCSIAWGACT